MDPKIALVLIATGPRYYEFIRPLLHSAEQYFPAHTPFLWTDSQENYVEHQFPHLHLGFPNATLYRYNTFLTQKSLLASFDFIFYSDIDMRFVAQIKTEEIVSDGITATEHPGHCNGVGFPERRPDSTAYIPADAKSKYFCGGFNGGTSADYLKMCEIIGKNVIIDASKGIVAINHDESHLNRYLFDFPPARILTPEFCWPDVRNDSFISLWRNAGRPFYQPKLMALEKGYR